MNECHARLDMLLHPTVEGEANVPPVAPAEGAAWIVGETPSGDWGGRSGQIAGWQSGNWIFVEPRPGMTVFDQSNGSVARFDGSWLYPQPVAEPAGGAIEDSEARTAISALISALTAAGVLPGT